MKYIVFGPVKPTLEVHRLLLTTNPERELVCARDVELDAVDPETHVVILVADQESRQLAKKALATKREYLSVVPYYSRFQGLFNPSDSRVYASGAAYEEFLVSSRANQRAA